jgi:hypothetical protein
MYIWLFQMEGLQTSGSQLGAKLAVAENTGHCQPFWAFFQHKSSAEEVWRADLSIRE